MRRPRGHDRDDHEPGAGGPGGREPDSAARRGSASAGAHGTLRRTAAVTVSNANRERSCFSAAICPGWAPPGGQIAQQVGRSVFKQPGVPKLPAASYVKSHLPEWPGPTIGAGMSFNLATMLTEATLAAPDAPACRFAGTTTTYRELDELSGRCAAGLRAAGLSHGQVVALQLPNIPHFLIAYFGA